MLAAALFAGSATGRANEPEAYVSPTESRLRTDVSYLADDRREGRGPGTRGLQVASEFIANAFQDAGLTTLPGLDGYFQPFTLRAEPTLEPSTAITLKGPKDSTIEPKLGTDFSPLAIGGAGKLEGLPIVFAGYGITAKDDALKLDYDDYKGLDVKGKAVLIIRREPQLNQEDSPFSGKATTNYATFRHKARNAADHEVAAVLIVNDQAGLGSEKDAVLDFRSTDGSGQGVPIVMITRELADRMLEGAGAPKLAELEKQIDDKLEPVSRPLEGWTVSGDIAISREPIPVRNVVGVIEGKGPLADETIVVGAHYDHLGRGGPGSLAMGSRDIHNGADDNASGTSMIIELARRLAKRPDPLPRRIVFMAFSGEERGLLGSKHYVDNPALPLDKTVAMVNFDMVGRLNDANELILFGAGTIPGMEELVSALATSQGLKPNVVKGTAMQFNASDHASFYYKDIPVLFAFTGTHPDYHRPSDDTERINFDGMEKIANFGELVLLDLANRPERPSFVKLTPGSAQAQRPREGGREGAMPYLGSRPAYGDDSNAGVKLEGVSEGSPAQKAGLQAGDLVVKLAGETVHNVEDYMETLMKHKPGETVEVVVKRGSEEKTIPVTLGTRSGMQ
jgi:hypothetical protein